MPDDVTERVRCIREKIALGRKTESRDPRKVI